MTSSSVTAGQGTTGRLSAIGAQTVTLHHESDAQGLTTALTQRTVLPSGLRVVTEQMAGVRSASVAVFVAVGSRHESESQHGCSHFLEHLLFKGTSSRSAMDISSTMDTLGGDFNAYTAKEYTCFHARVLDEDLTTTVDILGDMLTSATLSDADVEAERHVILDEIAMHDDDPDDVVHNLLAELAWGNTGLGRSIAGTEESITRLTRADIADFYRQWYVAPAMTVVAAGNVRHDDVVACVERSFGRSGFTDAEARPWPPQAELVAMPLVGGHAEVERDLEQVNLILAVPGLTRTDPRRYALTLLTTIVGGGSSSRLFQQVREQRGLAYSVFAFASHHADAGLVGVSVGCLPERRSEVQDVIVQLLAQCAREGVTAEELTRAQSQIRGGLILGMEDSGARASRLGKAELFYDELLTVDALIDRLCAVTAEEVQELAQELLTAEPLVAAVGPASGRARR